jgi:hypothetical protein
VKTKRRKGDFGLSPLKQTPNLAHVGGLIAHPLHAVEETPEILQALVSVPSVYGFP